MNTEENRLYLCANTGTKCENPTMVKGTDLCYCDRRYLKSVKVENLAEEKLQQAAENYKQNKIKSSLDDKYDAWLEGAKSPESLEYWKEKEKLYSEEEVKELLSKYSTSYESYDGKSDVWFDQNKKK